MANLIPFPSNKLVSNMPLLVAATTNSHNLHVHEKNPSKAIFLNKSLIIRSFSSRHRGLSLVPFNVKNFEPGEEDKSAVETVLKLYTAIKNQNIHEVSNIIGDECRCVCNFFSFFQFFHGKQQALELFKYVMEIFGKNIELVVQPTLKDGMNVGVSWKLQFCKTHIRLGKGLSFYICHIYQGKVLIRNVEMFVEPLLHIDPFRLKIMGYVTCTIEKIGSCYLSKDRVKRAILFLILTATILLFMKPGLY